MASKAFCRLYQSAIKVGNYFLGYKTPHLIEGPGSIKRLGAAVKKAKVKKLLVVIGPNIYKRGLADDMFASFDKEGVAYKVFSNLQANPTDENVEDGVKAYKEGSCEGIVAFGGGSPMDCAKAIAARIANPKKSVADLQGLLKAHKKICPLWAVPTTAGTGSETTIAAVITEKKTHYKAAINDTALLPRYAVLDPELTLGLPAMTTATTGMDALCHAVESYTNWTYCTQYEKQLALDAVKLIHNNLLDAVREGSNLKARHNMQRAAFYAGRSFTRGSVGYVHACGHPLSALYDLHHALVMAVLLPHVMRQFGEAAHKRLAELADVCGISAGAQAQDAADDAQQMQGTMKDSQQTQSTEAGAHQAQKAGTDAQQKNKEALIAQKAQAFIEWIEETNKACGIPQGFDCIQESDIAQMCEWADKEGNPLYPVPAIWQRKDFEKLYKTLQAHA